MDSPLLFPVSLAEDKIKVLDETKLPFKEEYIEVSSLEEALRVLKAMKTRSLGQVLLFFYSCVLFSGENTVDDMARRFSRQRPTFDFSFLGSLVKDKFQKGPSLKNSVEDFITRFDKMRKARADRLAKLLPESARICTICNFNGELLYLYQSMRKLDKSMLVYVSETRPYLQGTRLTFWELSKNNLPVRLICDAQAAHLMQKKLINAVIVGADRANLRGDIINKIGTYPLACLACYFDIPFYSLTQYPRDIDIEKISIEQRPRKEAFMYIENIRPEFKALYPAFDITKAEMITQSLQLGG